MVFLAENLARLLTIMGSGETSPTMVKVHRSVLERFAPPVSAVMLDTPFGFQENVEELCGKAIAYFSESLHTALNVASFRSAKELEHISHETEMARLRNASFVFAGPGSPTYALRQWQASIIPDILNEKLRTGGAVTFASAAAVTLGAYSAPIYEIYKVGEDPLWIEGLDIVGTALGMSVSVIPHYNNAEGGTHDTRFCYLGERRLAAMERELPEETFVLGIDEHTGIVFDLDAATAWVVGIGVVTLRSAGNSIEIASGQTVSIDRIVEIAAQLRSSNGSDSGGSMAGAADSAGAGAADLPAGSPAQFSKSKVSPLLELVAGYEKAFRDAMECNDVDTAIENTLCLEKEIAMWASETFSGNERELARSALRSMILGLGTLAKVGAKDPREIVSPFVDGLLGLRKQARAQGRYDDADQVRDLLVETGVEVRDTPEGTDWSI